MKNISSFSETGLGLEDLHAAFLDAFSDYVIPLQPSDAQFETLLNSRGFDADASMVACYGGEIAAFWNVANRASKAYLISSGTRVAHRGKGLAGQLGEASIAASKFQGKKSFCLEVIEGNSSAERLYGRLGFNLERRLDSYTLKHPEPKLSGCRRVDWPTCRATLQRFSSWQPSWQNSNETIASTPLRCFLHDHGAIVVGQGGLIHQIAAKTPDSLQALLAAAATEGPLRLINMDSADQMLRATLEELGAELLLRQSEMQRAI
ncbi:MAG: GNAT family N-acetyltransferase [Halieaceae bacterium]